VSFRVLVVEDSSTMRMFVAAALESVGDFEITAAPSGFEALKVLPRIRFDLIITDINMPDINGLELVRFVKDSPQYRETPLLIISTEGRERDRAKGLSLGADDYLVKPFAPEQLITVCRKLLAQGALRRSGASAPTSSNERP
jgi:two-component system chemotaxis response regulator CheY